MYLFILSLIYITQTYISYSNSTKCFIPSEHGSNPPHHIFISRGVENSFTS
jgi:hypothetical protein